MLYVSITVSLSLLFFVVGVGFTYFLLTDIAGFFSETLLSSYISGAGSFLGGLVGGIVAFIVARSQILNERKRLNRDKVSKVKNQIYLLTLELKSHLEIFELMKKVGENREDYKNSLTIDIWNEVKFELSAYLDKEEFERLSNYYNDCKDLIVGYLPDYKNLTDEDITIRIDILNKCLTTLCSLEVKLD